jgi:predicted benzoate:H+ symporter BenE
MAEPSEPDSVRRFLTAYGWFALIVAIALYGGGVVVFFFILPSIWLSPWAGVPIGVALTAITVAGVRRGWITLGDD